MLSLCRFLRKNIFRVGRLGMPAACALGIVRGKIIFILDSEKSADFSESFFTERGRDRKWQLQDLFLHFGKSIMIVIDAFSRYDPPVKRPIGKIRRFSRLANINSLSAKNAQSAAEGILNSVSVTSPCGRCAPDTPWPAPGTARRRSRR